MPVKEPVVEDRTSPLARVPLITGGEPGTGTGGAASTGVEIGEAATTPSGAEVLVATLMRRIRLPTSAWVST